MRNRKERLHKVGFTTHELRVLKRAIALAYDAHRATDMRQSELAMALADYAPCERKIAAALDAAGSQ